MNSQNYFIEGNFIKREKIEQNLFKNIVTRRIANFLFSLLYFLLIKTYKLYNRNKNTYKYTISICAIFKNEARFLDEWIRYHRIIGVDHFYLYNNNSEDDYMDVLNQYIENGVVDLINWPYDHPQMSAYNDCYKNRKKDTQWLTFIDIDEFICPLKADSIKTWLDKYIDYPGVAVYWKQFGSNGRLTHDYSKYVTEQYTQCWNKYSILTKMICNMNFEIKEFSNPHIIQATIFGIKLSPINQYKKIISHGIHRRAIFRSSNIQINHYWGKAYDTFLESKIKRSDAYHSDYEKMSTLRKQLLKSHETMCNSRDYNIQRFLLYTKLNDNN